jgi:cytochrome P450
MLQPERVIQDSSEMLYPPAPTPRPTPLGPLALLRVLANNPLGAWTQAHFEKPVVLGGLSIGRVALVSDPAAIRRVLMENSQNYHKDWLQRRVLSAGLTNGLLTVEGNQWRVQRRALAPLFARRTILGFSAAMVGAAHELVERLNASVGEVADLAVEATRLTLEVLERTMFSDGLGRSPEEIRVAMKNYFEAIGRLDPFDVLGVPAVVPRPRRLKVWPMMRLFESTIDTIVSTRRRRIADDPANVPRDILTLLLQARDPETGAGLSEVEVRANILTFIAAGHETTANSITWTLYLLSQSPEWRERVQAEADRELDGDVDGISERLVETRAVIEEAMRLYPPIAAISRAAVGPDELAGVPIKAGCRVVVAPYVLHRHRALWSDPDRFDPGRFVGAARDKIDRYAYLPFGVGPRICIGNTFALQEASIVVATVMRHFTLQLEPGHAVWPVHRVTVRPGGGLPMIVRRR